MICFEYSCKELVGSTCSHYKQEYMAFVTRRGFCPFSELGPNQPVKKNVKEKKRVGQQKAKGKK